MCLPVEVPRSSINLEQPFCWSEGSCGLERAATWIKSISWLFWQWCLQWRRATCIATHGGTSVCEMSPGPQPCNDECLSTALSVHTTSSSSLLLLRANTQLINISKSGFIRTSYQHFLRIIFQLHINKPFGHKLTYHFTQIPSEDVWLSQFHSLSYFGGPNHL